jgi:hypothetical protein
VPSPFRFGNRPPSLYPHYNSSLSLSLSLSLRPSCLRQHQEHSFRPALACFTPPSPLLSFTTPLPAGRHPIHSPSLLFTLQLLFPRVRPPPASTLFPLSLLLLLAHCSSPILTHAPTALRVCVVQPHLRLTQAGARAGAALHHNPEHDLLQPHELLSRSHPPTQTPRARAPVLLVAGNTRPSSCLAAFNLTASPPPGPL